VEKLSIERLAADDFISKQDLKYKDVFKLHPLFDKFNLNANLILVGPKGIAKTLSIASWVNKNGYPLVTVDCSEDIRRVHLMGMFTLRGDYSPFVLGPIPTAIQIANEVGHCVLCFEEINALTHAAQKMLNSIADHRRRIDLPECQRVFRLDSKAKLWLCGTMNENVYGGVYSLNEDLKSRFRMLPLTYPSVAEEKVILKVVLGISEKTRKKGQAPSPKDAVINKIITLAHETRQKNLAYSLSPRDVIQIVHDSDSCGLEAALRLSSGKFEGQDRDYYKTRVTSIFGIGLDK